MAGVTAYPFQRTITIDTTAGGADISSSLTDFPVCVAVNSSSWTTQANRDHFFSASNTSGTRVQFYDSAGTNLSYEVEYYDAVGGTAVYWVKVPSIAGSATTTVTVGYGADPNGADQSSGTATWDANFVAVYHGYGAGDSTTNGNTFNTTNSLTSVTGTVRLGYGTSSSTGARGYRTTGSGWSNNTDATITGWLSSASLLASKSYGGFGNLTVGGGGINWWQSTTSQINGDIGGGGKAFSTNITSTPSHRGVVATTGQARGALICYTNGADDTGADFGTSYNSAIQASTPIAIGTAPGDNFTNYRPNSTVDEARYSKVARSAAWIKAEYFSMKSTSWNGDGWMTLAAETANRRVYVIGRAQAVNRSASF